MDGDDQNQNGGPQDTPQGGDMGGGSAPDDVGSQPVGDDTPQNGGSDMPAGDDAPAMPPPPPVDPTPAPGTEDSPSA